MILHNNVAFRNRPKLLEGLCDSTMNHIDVIATKVTEYDYSS